MQTRLIEQKNGCQKQGSPTEEYWAMERPFSYSLQETTRRRTLIREMKEPGYLKSYVESLEKLLEKLPVDEYVCTD